MTLENITIGMEIKNYKQLCELLGIRTTTGNGKKKQLSQLQRLFEWNRDGHKYIITEVYDKPKRWQRVNGEWKLV